MPDNQNAPERRAIPRLNPRAVGVVHNPVNVWPAGRPEVAQVVQQRIDDADRQRELEQVLLDELVASALKPKKTDDSQTLQNYYGIKPIPQATKAMKEHGVGTNLFGVELEIENWPVDIEDSESPGFRFTSDGSLRGRSVEAISFPNSLKGTIVVTENLWKKYDVTTDGNFSERTSIHVHANVLHFTEDNLKTLMLTYATIEDLLFDFIGQDRYKNIFCVPWSEAGIHVGRFRSLLEQPRHWQKYTALNLAPVRSQGTVEFRHMEGHASIDRLTKWLTIIDELMTYSYKNAFDDVYKVVKNLNNDSEYTKWISSALPISRELFSNSQLRAKLHRGVIEAKLLALKGI